MSTRTWLIIAVVIVVLTAVLYILNRPAGGSLHNGGVQNAMAFEMASDHG